MPYLRVDLAGPVDGSVKRALLSRCAEEFARIVDSPVERVRTQVLEWPADGFAVGGIPISESNEQAPLIWIEMLEGRPERIYGELIEQLSELVAGILGIGLDRVRVRINEIRPQLWGIAGRPAAEVRGAEMAARQDGPSDQTVRTT
jgi:4-oxalocrotonate tautomerase family enzyme